MKGNRVARRRRASSFPEITGVRLAPIGGEATLVNLSATGALVECASRLAPGKSVTVIFEGSFTPSSVDSRVVRCEVAGIGSDGSLRFHLGLTFAQRLMLADDEEPDIDEAVAMLLPPPAAVAPRTPAVLRNRW
jgi:hypothetical protein